MSLLPRPAAARSEPKKTRGVFFFMVSVAAILLLLPSSSSRQDYKQNGEVLVNFIHRDAGFYFDHVLHSVLLVTVPENGSRSESIVK